jgi:hypothetical protein
MLTLSNATEAGPEVAAWKKVGPGWPMHPRSTAHYMEDPGTVGEGSPVAFMHYIPKSLPESQFMTSGLQVFSIWQKQILMILWTIEPFMNLLLPYICDRPELRLYYAHPKALRKANLPVYIQHRRTHSLNRYQVKQQADKNNSSPRHKSLKSIWKENNTRAEKRTNARR